MKRLIAYVFLIIAIPCTPLCQNVSQINILNLLNSGSEVEKNYDYYIIDFWATWCPNCLKSLSYFNQLAKDCSPFDNLCFIAVNSFETLKVTELYLNEMNLQLNIISDTTSLIYNYYEIKILPTAIIVDKGGDIIWKGRISLLDAQSISEMSNNNKRVSQRSNVELLESNIEISYIHDTSYMYVSFSNVCEIKFHNKDVEGILANLLILQSDYDFNYTIENAPLEPFLNFSVASTLPIDEVSRMALEIIRRYFPFSYDSCDTLFTFHNFTINDQLADTTSLLISNHYYNVDNNVIDIQGSLSYIMNTWEKLWGVQCHFDSRLINNVYHVVFPSDNIENAISSLMDQGILIEQEIKSIQIHKIKFH